MGGRQPMRSLLSGASIAAVVFPLAIAAAGCGGSSEETPGASAPAAKSSFPSVNGRTLAQLAADVGGTDELVASPAGRVFRVGENRFGFGLFTVGREQITDAEAAIYVAQDEDQPARGPFPARSESLETRPAFVARTTAADPDAATVVYASQLKLPARGEWRLVAVVRRGEELAATRMPSIVVRRYAKIPAPGERPPRIHTPTVEDVGDLSKIDTRVPPSTMHEDDFAEVLGEKPVVLLFATPALCQSRVCGPVVDVAEQVKSEYSDEEIAFIFMEVYRNNDLSAGIRPQLEAFGLTTEPWLFVVDAEGRVSTAIEGGFGLGELREAVERVLPR